MFQEVVAQYLGAESPCCRGLRGASIPHSGRGGNRTLDAHGFQLDNATLPGNGWKAQHDTLDRMLFLDALQSGIPGKY